MRVNIFIRKENEEAWKAIPNKSEWVNTLLADTNEHKQEVADYIVASTPQTEYSLEQFLQDYSDPTQKKPPHPTYGYPCCHNPTPCKHWQWSTDHAQWVNTLTGKAREE